MKTDLIKRLEGHIETLRGVASSVYSDDIREAVDALEQATRWIPVTERLPDEYKTVLVQHADDLYPVTAYRMQSDAATVTATTLWVYESDGPEDIDPGPQHRHLSLWRDPTHWMPLPKGPLFAGEPTDD